MLFSLNPNTPQCDVFRVLNDELLHFLCQSVNATAFSDALFSTYQDGQNILRSECWENEPTRVKFQVLWNELPQDVPQRQQLYDQINAAQTINTFFSDTFNSPPRLPDNQFNVLKQLTTHLFTRTASLVNIERQAGTAVKAHFQLFRQANGNTQLCYVCGTSQLSQDRIGRPDNEQWRADYDHLLCKDKHPIYGVHPGNFIPTCHICNSKAKGSFDLLYRAANQRRLAFYPLPPLQESCSSYMSVTMGIKQLHELTVGNWEQPLGDVMISFTNASYNIEQKINTWIDAFQVPSRVKSFIADSLVVRLTTDLLAPTSFQEFTSRLRHYAANVPLDVKRTEWRFWLFRLYQYLSQQDDILLQSVWALMEWNIQQTNQQALNAEFGV
ncbi:hypothetical protein [Rheinheimera sp. UJ63]|uniref:hypothetical protein n=1 Tax=Rheinheimera sp. UJ63 TaxID=2910157 RepID=UPI001F1990E4|nr:hypothetical protein [Rheinheimera sp. UJ63]MCF4009992.1 hypothetical protein [Rheinheimera sp. UJ63]